MGFDRYVRENGSREACLLTIFRDFPKSVEWQQLRLFINSHRFTDELNVELENLHDNYWLGGGTGG